MGTQAKIFPVTKESQVVKNQYESFIEFSLHSRRTRKSRQNEDKSFRLVPEKYFVTFHQQRKLLLPRVCFSTKICLVVFLRTVCNSIELFDYEALLFLFI